MSKISVVLNVESIEELFALFSKPTMPVQLETKANAGATVSAVISAPPETTTDAPKRGRKSKASQATPIEEPVEAQPEEIEDDADDFGETVDTATESVTKEQMEDALMKVGRTKGREAVVIILKKLNAVVDQKMPDGTTVKKTSTKGIKPEQYNEAYAQAQAALKAE